MTTGEITTLPVHCADCGGAVTLQVADWPAAPGEAVERGWWKCPYCDRWNVVRPPGRLVWATKGHTPPPIV